MNPDADWKRADARHHDREADRYDDLIGREYAPYAGSHTTLPWGRWLASEGAGFVLDIGGGTGRAALEIARMGPTVMVVDASRGMLARARGNARGLGSGMGSGNVRFVHADAERLPFADRSMDGVVCQGVLHHLPDVASALAEADRVLRPGGRLCLAEPDEAGSLPSRAIRAAGRLARPVVAALRVRRSPAAAHERPLDPAALTEPLRRRGYLLTSTFLVHPPYLYRFVSPGAARAVAAWLNPPERPHARGDLVVVQARKPVAGRSGAPDRGVC